MYVASTKDLTIAINDLEQTKKFQKETLALQYRQLREGLKPSNLVKGAFSDVRSSPDFGRNILDATLGAGAGFLSKKLFVRGSGNIIKKIFGTLLELGIAGTVAKNSSVIKDAAGGIFKLFSKKETVKKL